MRELFLRTGDWKSRGNFSRNEILLAIYCREMSSEKTTDGGWQEKRGWDLRRRSDWSIDDKDLSGSEQLSSLGSCLATDTGLEISLDGEVRNAVYVVLVKSLLAQSGICRFAVAQRAEFL